MLITSEKKEKSLTEITTLKGIDEGQIYPSVMLTGRKKLCMLSTENIQPLQVRDIDSFYVPSGGSGWMDTPPADDRLLRLFSNCVPY